MTFKQLIQLLPKVVRYNLKIIFAGKFFWFLLAAFGFFALFMFQNAWKREEINEGLIYSILMFPSMLLIFYPAVFGIQNDEDSRILEILFGIPDYKYKVIDDLCGNFCYSDYLFIHSHFIAVSGQSA